MARAACPSATPCRHRIAATLSTNDAHRSTSHQRDRFRAERAFDAAALPRQRRRADRSAEGADRHRRGLDRWPASISSGRNATKIAYWESERDRECIMHSTRRWVAPGASGSTFLAPTISLAGRRATALAPHLEQAPSACRIVYAQAAFVSEAGETLEILGKPWREFRVASCRIYAPAPGGLPSSHLFEVHGPFNETFKDGGDYENAATRAQNR